MRRLIIAGIFILSSLCTFAQSGTGNPYGHEERKKIYNYLTGELFLNSPEGMNQSQYISAIRYSTCFTNGKYHQFGIGTGIVSHTAASDTARANYIGIPLYITNRFYLSDPQEKGIVLYIECHGGYHLPLSGTFQSGSREGQPIPPLLPKGTGFYGFTFGARIPIAGSTAMILEFIYRNQHIPYAAGTNFYPIFIGVGGGLSF